MPRFRAAGEVTDFALVAVYGQKVVLFAPATRVASRDKTPLFAEGRTLTIEKFKYALESWQQKPAIARYPKAQLFHCNA
jgi:hypothetical protein